VGFRLQTAGQQARLVVAMEEMEPVYPKSFNVDSQMAALEEWMASYLQGQLECKAEVLAARVATAGRVW